MFQDITPFPNRFKYKNASKILIIKNNLIYLKRIVQTVTISKDLCKFNPISEAKYNMNSNLKDNIR